MFDVAGRFQELYVAVYSLFGPPEMSRCYPIHTKPRSMPSYQKMALIYMYLN